MSSLSLIGTSKVLMTRVYHNKVEDGSHIYLLLYLDDMLIASQNLLAIQKLKSQLNSEFEMKDMGTAKKIMKGNQQRGKSR